MSQSPLRILLVDDSEHDRLAFCRAFEKSQVIAAIDECERAEQALEQLEKDLDAFDVIVTDYKLPGLSGLELCQELIRRQCLLPLVLMTGAGTEHLAVEALKVGVHDYIVKDSRQGYLQLLPVALPDIVRKHNDGVARQKAEAALVRRAQELAALYATSLEINAQPDLDTLLHSIVQRAAGLLDARMGGLYLTRPDNEMLELVVSYNLPRDYTGTILRLGEGLSGRVAQTGQPMMVADYEHWAGKAQAYADLSIRRILGVPLKHKGQIMGVINITDDARTEAFSEEQIRLVSLFADQAAIAISNARLYEVVRQSNAELQARNEELDAYAHTVAHDLKGPLATVTGFAELLLESGDQLSDQDRHESHTTILHTGRKMFSIIEELLLLAGVRQATVEIGPLDMGQIVNEAQQRLANLIAESHAQIVCPETWPAVLGYGPWVEEVWANYLSNGLKYGGQPPRLVLGADPLPNPPACGGGQPACGRQGWGMVRFWVRDNGAGLVPEAQARLFTPFTRLDQARAQGHGLGLSIVRRIVEKLGGQVGVESAGVSGQGSLFYFTLPSPAAARPHKEEE